MRKNLCIIILALITFSCADKPADNNKEKNKVEAVKKNIKEIQIVLNSNDLMQYDKKVLSASPGQEITLTLQNLSPKFLPFVLQIYNIYCTMH